MKAKNQKLELAEKIALLKIKQMNDLFVLKHQYQKTMDSFKPVNLLKDSVSEALSSPILKTNLVGGTIGFGVNYLTQKMKNSAFGNHKSSVFGKVVKFIFTNFIGKK